MSCLDWANCRDLVEYILIKIVPFADLNKAGNKENQRDTLIAIFTTLEIPF